MCVFGISYASQYFLAKAWNIVSPCRHLHVPVWVSSRWKHTNSQQYKAVIFDMCGVLIPSPATLAAEWEFRNSLQPGWLWKTILSGENHVAWDRCMLGELTFEEFAAVVSKEKQTSNIIKPCLQAMTSQLKYQIPAMREAIQCIRAEGLKTAILTNNFWFKDQSFLPVEKVDFDVIIESCREGIKKPNPEIYKLCLEHLKVHPTESIYLDDSGRNLEPAAQLGMITIKVGDTTTAIQKLESLLRFPLHGYVYGTQAVRKDTDIPTDRLKEYLQTTLGLSSGEPLTLRQFSHGQSNFTYHMRSGDQQLILRKKPPGKLLQSAHAVKREYRVMKALGSMGVPVPRTLAICEDPSVLGTSFYLMEYCPGRIFKDPTLPGQSARQRTEIYSAMNHVLCQIHQVDIHAAGLDDYGKHGSYIQRQVCTWTEQYRASETHNIQAMEQLIKWLPENLPTHEKTTIVHGDFRLDNLIFHPEKPEVLAILDWELSTLGDPICDVACSCLAHYLPLDFPILKGLNNCDLTELGIPSDLEYLTLYCDNMGMNPVENWNFYMAFTFFRVAAILQGVYKRSLQGQASSAKAETAGKLAENTAELSWMFAIREGFRKFKSIPTRNPNPPVRKYSTWNGQRSSATNFLYTFSLNNHCRHLVSVPKGHLIVSPEGLSPRIQELYHQLTMFMDKHIYPLEEELMDYQRDENRWIPNPRMEKLKSEAKANGLWNLFLPLKTDPEIKYGAGLTNLEYAHLCEVMGRSLHAPEVFNCSAPDTGNMEILLKYGTEAQKEQWLLPLLEGKIRSCFAMTEPQVASSDATNIKASIVEVGDSFILNGHKWWTSGAMDPRCKLCVFMGKTDPQAHRHRQQSMILVSMDTPGIKVVRPLSVFGIEDPPGGHGELIFENVQVPKQNILLGPGRGFEIAQGRLGPGRIHHCMRLIGYADRALQLMKDRVKTRVAFGRPLAEQGTIMTDIANSRIEIEQARLLVLKAAHLMDTVSDKEAASEISMIKLVAPSMALHVIDRAIQAFGAAGLSSDYPLAQFFGWARALRLADGPDEVHRAVIAKLELKR
ncbi:acyl-CoA dehydrogenase family member 10 isoform X1 [Rhincodon typus]|uniref:acyl-CoA dehydrogenase family member 10 isoform X1 n=1 Tax=Rhincodon typus TaxID=259920 RepID=UPI0020300EC9|nr:acyl-CoA dehydrogenase family member 10 isoform X1 [Rhincodon typus]XP_048467160.1 acyl-CoA dehydrogenase family member 10 isoform X1 [Rhincodon typus]